MEKYKDSVKDVKDTDEDSFVNKMIDEAKESSSYLETELLSLRDAMSNWFIFVLVVSSSSNNTVPAL